VDTARLSAELATLFPTGVVAAELFGQVGPEVLRPEELQVTTHYAPKRMADFAGGRLCARLALAQLGWSDYALLPRADRVPSWPSALTGSITHTEGYCGAVAACLSDVRSIGVDCERIGAISAEIWDQIFRPAEQAALRELPNEQQDARAALIFAAKEAFYKCQYSLTGDWVGFEEVEIATEGGSQLAACGSFQVRPQQALRFQSLCPAMPQGRFLQRGHFMVAGIAVPT
jgi:4'-phosphopantetheinyl transferase EntD